MSDNGLRQSLARRLFPLYIAGFFQSFVLWYTIEKLFMHSIGFNDTEIGLMVAVYSAVMLFVETPSGILADRWSRKGVLLLASIFLAASSLIGAASHGIALYLFSAIFWGIFFACYSGMYDTIIYDCVTEEKADSKMFDYLYGRCEMADSIGLVTGGLLGAFIANVINLRAVYLIATPVALLGVVALLFFNEPTLHKKQQLLTINSQLRSIIRAILKNRSLIPVIVVLIIRAAIIYILFEFAQLWLIALQTPTRYYGIAYGILFSSVGLGGMLVNRLKLSTYTSTVWVLLVTILSSLGLVVLRNTYFIVLSQLFLASALTCTYIVFSRLLHDTLSPTIRAGAASATSTIGRFFIIPLALLFGYISQHLSVYKAGVILLVLTVAMAPFVLAVTQRDSRVKLGLMPPLGDLEK